MRDRGESRRLRGQAIGCAPSNDPPYGAGINYYLKQTAPAGTVTITILDSKGQVVRVLPGTTSAGINRIHWNLRYETSTPIQMRTTRRSSEGGPVRDSGAAGNEERSASWPRGWDSTRTCSSAGA